MQVFETSMNYGDLSPAEAAELFIMAKDCVYSGKVPDKNHPLISEWLRVCKFDDRQFLLVISTVWPTRVFFSLLIVGGLGKVDFSV